MKTLFQLTVLLLLCGSTLAQNNVNNPDPQNGEHGSDPSINTQQTKDPAPMPDYPNGPPYPTSNPTDPYNPPHRDSLQDGTVHNGSVNFRNSDFSQVSRVITHSTQLSNQFSSLNILSHSLGISGPCTYCSATGKCKWCDGTGTETCIDCKGTGEEGTVKNADGTTTILKCYRCSGRGSYNCNFCKTTGKCTYCDGTGISPYQAASHFARIVVNRS